MYLSFSFFFSSFFFEKRKQELQKPVRKGLGNDWVYLREKKTTTELSEKAA